MNIPTSRGRLIATALTAILTAPACLAAQGRSAYSASMSLPSAERGMMERATLVAPGIHFFRPPLPFGPAPLSNEVLIEQSDGFVLVDAGKTRGAGKRIVQLIRSIGTKPVKAVIITHWHPDHVLGLGPIVEAWPQARIISSAATLGYLKSEDSYATMPKAGESTAAHDESRAASLRQYADEYGPHLRDTTLSREERAGWADVLGVLNQRIADERGTYLVLPTVTFTTSYTIPDAVRPVEARFIGAAHTDGDIVVWMPNQRVVAAGDIIVAPIPYGGTNVLDWPGTLAQLERLRPRVILPGHGPAERDTHYVERMIAALQSMRTQAARLVDGPQLSDDSVLARIDLSKSRTRFAGHNRWLGYWFDQYFAPNAAVAYQELRKPGGH